MQTTFSKLNTSISILVVSVLAYNLSALSHLSIFFNHLNSKNVMKQTLTSILIIAFLSCKQDIATTLDNDPNTIIICGTKDPIRDLKWLSDEMKLLTGGPEMNGIVLFEYKNNKVIEIQCSVCSSLNIHQYYCDGTKLDFVSTDENYKQYNDYVLNRKQIKILYGTKIWK